MNDTKTLIKNYLAYCSSQKCLDKKTLKAYQIDLRRFLNKTLISILQKLLVIYWNSILLG